MTTFTYMMDGRTPKILRREDVEFAKVLLEEEGANKLDAAKALREFDFSIEDAIAIASCAEQELNQ